MAEPVQSVPNSRFPNTMQFGQAEGAEVMPPIVTGDKVWHMSKAAFHAYGDTQEFLSPAAWTFYRLQILIQD